MAIINESLSTLLVAGHWLEPDNLSTAPLLDYELGGVGLNDTSQGLEYQTWIFRYFPATGVVQAEASTTGTKNTLFIRSGITAISCTFDQNMNPFVAFVENGDAKFWWYDTALPGTTFTNLPAGSLTPKCCLDDKRRLQNSASDIILTYVHNGALKYRHQRDRYTDEKILQDPFLHPTLELPAVIKKVGMNEFGRLQWRCDLANPIDWCGYVNYGN
jgi:hypothetical protein